MKKEAVIEQPILQEIKVSSQVNISKSFESLKLIHIQILKGLYLNDVPITFKELWKRYKQLRMTDKTLKKKIHELEKLGLIDTVRSWNLMLIPKVEIKETIIKEINKFYSNLENERI